MAGIGPSRLQFSWDTEARDRCLAKSHGVVSTYLLSVNPDSVLCRDPKPSHRLPMARFLVDQGCLEEREGGLNARKAALPPLG
jgi:hypothetical protein